jgi:peptidoglycan hydrolase-like protein with peptidoglycan-binding domain
METLVQLNACTDNPSRLLLPDLTSTVSVLGITSTLLVGMTATHIPMASATLKRGDRCDSVTKLQEALVKAGFNPGKVDGDFGAGTEYAVQRFQEKNKLTTDRVVGQSTASGLGLDPKISCETNKAATTTASSTTASTTTASTTTASSTTPSTPAKTTPTATSANTPKASTNTSATITVPVKFGKVATEGGDLNVRSGPGESYGVVKSLTNGSTVRFIGQPVDSWLQLVEGGWIHKNWVKFESSAQDKSTAKPATAKTATSTSSTSSTSSTAKPSATTAATTAPKSTAPKSTAQTSGTSSAIEAKGGTATPIYPASTVLQIGKTKTGGVPLNVRKGPGSNYDVASQLADQKDITVLVPDGGKALPDWVELTTGGWVASQWIEVKETVKPQG